jgi:diguanylate cyclase (GGDEF)-like protein/PAS domain S-box-containing protein
MPIAFGHKSSAAHRRWVIALPMVLLLLGLILTGVEVHRQETRERAALRVDMQHTLTSLTAALERKLIANAQTLRGVAGLFGASEKVTREEFHQYIEALHQDVGATDRQGIGYAQRLDAPGVTSGEIVFFEPDERRHLRALTGMAEHGVFVSPTYQRAMALARDGDQPAMTVRLALGDASVLATQGFVIFVPVYEREPRGDVGHRQQLLRGWAFMPMPTPAFIDAVMEAEFPMLKGIADLHISEITANDSKTLLYVAGHREAAHDVQKDAPKPSHPQSEHLYVTHPSAEESERVYSELRFGGASWRLSLAPMSTWRVAHEATSIVALWLMGCVLSFSAALAAFLLLRNDERIALALSETRLARTVFDHAFDAMLVTDAANNIVSVNAAFERITGFTREEIRGQNPRVLSSGLQTTEFFREMWQAIQTTGVWEGELWNRRKNGELYSEMLAVCTVRDSDQRVVNYVGSFRDTTMRRQADERIRYLAHHDQLTGLPNRNAFLDRVSQVLTLARRYERRVGILFLDLDHFKPINDQFGHQVGDVVLRVVAMRLRECIRESDTPCRQGGDEFLVLIPEVTQIDQLRDLALKLIEAIDQPITVSEQNLHVTASVGVAIYPEDGSHSDDLIQAADTAMYAAKGRSSPRVVLAPGLRQALGE